MENQRTSQFLRLLVGTKQADWTLRSFEIDAGGGAGGGAGVADIWPIISYP